MDRFDSAKKVGIFGIVGNVFLFFLKIAVGIISKSQAMIADALNSAGDVFASFMTWLGNRISSVPNDEDHNYGHGKAEYIFSMLISISMMIIAFKLLYDSVVSIILGNHLVFSWKLIFVCLVTIVVKLALYLYTKLLYQKQNNLLVKANMIDHRNDMVITLFTTLAILLTKCNIYFVDGIVGIGISIWIFIVGVKIYKESYDVLMDSSIDSESKKVILEIIKNCKVIKRIGTLYSIPIGYRYIVVLTIFVNGNMQTSESHEVTEQLERKILNRVEKVEKVVVHVEPYTSPKKKKTFNK